MSLELLENELLNLPVEDRSKLIDRLVASIETDLEIQNAWTIEAARRSSEIRNGTVQTVSGDAAIAVLLAKKA